MRVAVAAALAGAALAAVPADRVATLPGFGTPLTALYSGYLDAGAGKHHHYVYSESRNNPATDDLVIWCVVGRPCARGRARARARASGRRCLGVAKSRLAAAAPRRPSSRPLVPPTCHLPSALPHPQVQRRARLLVDGGCLFRVRPVPHRAVHQRPADADRQPLFVDQHHQLAVHGVARGRGLLLLRRARRLPPHGHEHRAGQPAGAALLVRRLPRAGRPQVLDLRRVVRGECGGAGAGRPPSARARPPASLHPSPLVLLLAQGIYIPTLAYAIYNYNTANPSSPINLQGILVGNGCIGNAAGHCGNDDMNDYNDIITWRGHGLVSQPLYDAILGNCTWSNENAKCDRLLNEAASAIGK